jgi:flagellar biosynthesis/type III secretory pathway protein FliH
MIAANHHQGLHEGIEIGRREGLEKGRFEGEIVGQIKSLMERFVDDEDMERALRRIAKNSLARNLVERVWADCGEARIIPENKHVEDFIAILQNAGVLT